jgi:hypothetical protein
MADVEAAVTSAGVTDGLGCTCRVARDKLALHSLKALRSSDIQVMGVGALDSGAIENVVQWCLGGHHVRHKSPIEVQHAEKLTELTGYLGRVAVLEMGHSFSRGSEPSTDTL